MFSRISNKNATPAKSSTPMAPPSAPIVRSEPVKPVPPSILASDLKIVGDLTSKGEIQVDGAVEGDIRCQVLVVGQNGMVTGEIIADTVRIHGTVTGQIRSRSVFLAATARMVGDIAHESLAIEPGAFLEGHCGRIDPKKDAPRVEPAKAGMSLADAATLTLPPELKKATA
jgi:cytoskeletal protein CcmA (bactofilin family)